MVEGWRAYLYCCWEYESRTKTNMCDWVVMAWNSISTDLVKKSFVACGQAKGGNLEDISCLKPGRPGNEALVGLKALWDYPLKKIDIKNLNLAEDEESNSEISEDEEKEEDPEYEGN